MLGDHEYLYDDGAEDIQLWCCLLLAALKQTQLPPKQTPAEAAAAWNRTTLI